MHACFQGTKERAPGRPSNLFVSHGIKWRIANMENELRRMDKELWRPAGSLFPGILDFSCQVLRTCTGERATNNGKKASYAPDMRNTACCGLACVLSASPRSSRLAGQTAQAPLWRAVAQSPCLACPSFRQCIAQHNRKPAQRCSTSDINSTEYGSVFRLLN